MFNLRGKSQINLLKKNPSLKWNKNYKRGEKVELKPDLGTRDTMGSYMHHASAQREKIV